MDDQQQQISTESTFTGTLGQTANPSVKGKHKRKSKGCKCRGDCRKKRCGCNSLNQKCTINCNCTDRCKNRESSPPPSSSNLIELSDDTKENVIIEETDGDNKSDTEHTFKFKSPQFNKNIQSEGEKGSTAKTNASTYLTPKMAR